MKGMVFGFLSNPSATREELNQSASSAGMKVSTPGLDKRVNMKGAAFLKTLLLESLQHTVRVDSKIDGTPDVKLKHKLS